MAVPKSSGELISLGGVKWHEPLAEYYSKHAQALDRNLADSINERNRALEIKKKESLLNQIKQGGDALTAVAKAASTWKTISDQQQAEEKKKLWESLENEPWWIENREDLRKYRSLTYFEKKRELSTNETARLKELRAKFELDKVPEAMHAILNASGTRLANQNELLARHTIAGLSEASMQTDQDWEDHEAWNKAPEGSDKRVALFKKYQLSKIEGLNLNDDAIAAVLGKELIRQSQTVRGTGKAAAAVAVSTAEQRRVFSQLITAQRTGSVEETIWSIREELLKSPNFAATEFQTTTQLVDEYLSETLTKLAYDGFINESELQPYIDSGFRHPAGKGPESETTPGEIFFGADKVNRLVSAAREGSGRKLAVQMSIAKDQLGPLKEAALRGEDVTAQLQDIEIKFPELKEQIQDIRDTNVKDNTPEAYAKEKEDWEIELENGNIVAAKEAAKLIKNKKLRDEVEAKIRLHEKVRERVNYSERWIDIKVAEGMNLTLEADDPLNERGIKVRNDLLKYFRKDFQRRIEADPDNPEALNESIRAVEEYWISNGGKNKDERPKVKGKFTVTNNGRYEAYDKYSGLVSKRRQNALLGSSVTNVKTWDNEVNQAWKLARDNPQFGGRNTLERMVRTPGLLSPDDIIGAYENGILSQEIITKARRIGIEPTTLLKAQTLALQESDDKELLNVLGQSQIDSFPNKGELLYDAIKRSGNGDLIYLMNRVGPKNWTANQFQRVRNELAKQAEFQSNIKTQTEEGINQIEQERRPETYTGPTY